MSIPSMVATPEPDSLASPFVFDAHYKAFWAITPGLSLAKNDPFRRLYYGGPSNLAKPSLGVLSIFDSMLTVPTIRDRIIDKSSKLDHALVAIKVLANVADVASVIPGVRAAANIVLNIATVAKAVKDNQQDCLDVAIQCTVFVIAAGEATQGHAVTDIDPKLLEDIQRFTADLQVVQELLTEQANHNAFTQVLNHSGDMERINKCKEMLDYSYRTFQLHSAIAMRLQLSAMTRVLQLTTTAKHPCVYLVHGPNPKTSFGNQSSHPVMYQGKQYPTGVHLFKALKFTDTHISEKIRNCGSDPDIAAEIERRYAKAIQPNWRDITIQMCEKVLWLKFTQHPKLLQELLDTGDAEIVNDSGSRFWGVGPKDNRNELGKALMRLRTKVRQGIS